MSCPTSICNFFCSLKCPLCWFAGMKMSTMVPCIVSASSTELTLPGPAMQLSSSCCLFFVPSSSVLALELITTTTPALFSCCLSAKSSLVPFLKDIPKEMTTLRNAQGIICFAQNLFTTINQPISRSWRHVGSYQHLNPRRNSLVLPFCYHIPHTHFALSCQIHFMHFTKRHMCENSAQAPRTLESLWNMYLQNIQEKAMNGH